VIGKPGIIPRSIERENESKEVTGINNLSLIVFSIFDKVLKSENTKSINIRYHSKEDVINNEKDMINSFFLGSADSGLCLETAVRG
jgi:hypothetical protein